MMFFSSVEIAHGPLFNSNRERLTRCHLKNFTFSLASHSYFRIWVCLNSVPLSSAVKIHNSNKLTQPLGLSIKERKGLRHKYLVAFRLYFSPKSSWWVAKAENGENIYRLRRCKRSDTSRAQLIDDQKTLLKCQYYSSVWDILQRIIKTSKNINGEMFSKAFISYDRRRVKLWVMKREDLGRWAGKQRWTRPLRPISEFDVLNISKSCPIEPGRHLFINVPVCSYLFHSHEDRIRCQLLP